jgi:hypothetical protein
MWQQRRKEDRGNAFASDVSITYRYISDFVGV